MKFIITGAVFCILISTAIIVTLDIGIMIGALLNFGCGGIGAMIGTICDRVITIEEREV